MAQLLTEQRFDTVNVLENVPATAESKGKFRFEAIVSEADFVNRNRRKYPMEILWPAFEKVNANLAQYPGAVDHPDPWSPVKIEEQGIKWLRFWQDGNYIKGEGEIIPTDKGRNLQVVMEAGVAVGFSTRAKASSKIEEDPMTGGIVEVITGMTPPFVDAVTDPSVGHARVTSTTKEGYEGMEANALLELLEAKTLKLAQAEVAVELATVQEAARASEAAKTEAVAKLEAANARIAELEAQIAEAALADQTTLITARLAELTADDRFGATIRVKALKVPGISLENAEQVVSDIRELVNEVAAASNESVAAPATPAGDLTSDEDAEPVETVTEESRANLRAMGLL